MFPNLSYDAYLDIKQRQRHHMKTTNPVDVDKNSQQTASKLNSSTCKRLIHYGQVVFITGIQGCFKI